MPEFDGASDILRAGQSLVRRRGGAHAAGCLSRRNGLRLPLAVLAEARDDHLLLTSGHTQRLRFDRRDAG